MPGVALLAGFHLLAEVRLFAVSVVVPETSVVSAGVVGCPRVVGSEEEVISGLLAVTASAIRAVVGL